MNIHIGLMIDSFKITSVSMCFVQLKHKRIFNLVFYDSNFTGEAYLNILRNAVVLVLNNERSTAWYQQDEAVPQNYHQMSVLLTELFEDRWNRN